MMCVTRGVAAAVWMCQAAWWHHRVHGALGGLKRITDDLDVASEDFLTLVATGIFVDKSLLINETLTSDDRVIQITRPRKWGKTVNLSMLRRFLEIELDKSGVPLPEEKKINPVLFKGGKAKMGGRTKTFSPLMVSGLEDVMGHLGAHPVIHVTLRHVKGVTYREFEEGFKNVIVDLFQSYAFLNKYLEEDDDSLSVDEKVRLAKFVTGKFEDQVFVEGFEFLSMLLHKHYRSEVCLFIDDYDYPIINAYRQFGDRNEHYDSIVVLIRVLFENAFKENQYLFKGVITGTLNFLVVSRGISEDNFVGFHTVLDKSFSEFYGFAQKDIGELLGKAYVLFNPLLLRKWYGGFYVNTTKQRDVEIYNPWSVMKSLSKRGKYDYYMQKSFETDFTRMMDHVFTTANMQEYFHLLIEGKELIRSTLGDSVYLKSVSGDPYSVMVHAGYLFPIPPARMTDRPIWRMKIPNMDVRGVFAAGVGKWVARELKLSDREYETFITLLASNQAERFAEDLGQLLNLNNCSETTDEQYYQTLLGGLISSLGMKFKIISIEKDNRKSGYLMIPFEKYGRVLIKIRYIVAKEEDSGLDKWVETNLDELQNEPYPVTPQIKALEHLDKIMFVALAFCGPKVLARQKIENIIEK